MNELKVGLLAIASIIMVVYMSFRITSQQSGFGTYVPYRTIIDDASGIFPKTPIRVAGITAGRIKSIELQANAALITFEVLEKVKVTEGSQLVVKTVGFLGDKYLEIRINEKSDSRMEADTLIESGMGRSLDDLTRDTSKILDDVKEIVHAIKDAVSPEDGRRPLTDLFDDTQDLLTNVKAVSESLRKAIDDNSPKIGNLVDNLNKFAQDLRYQLDKDEKDNVLTDIKSVLAEADKVMANLNDMVADMKKGKGTIGKLIVEDEIADEVKETISGVKKIVDKVRAVRTELALSTGVNTNGEAETLAGLRIFPSPERFYVLGLSTSKIGVIKERETTTTVNGGSETVQNTKVVDKNTYRFNVQIGRKIHDWSFRAGLIESTGGVGVDYEIPRWRTLFGVEAFDFHNGDGVNLRLSSEAHIWNVFYGRVSGNNITRESRSATISIGLRFLDEDLKGLLGFFL